MNENNDDDDNDKKTSIKKKQYIKSDINQMSHGMEWHMSF